MLSQHWPALDRNAFKVLVFLVGAIAAWTARRAARLWQKASDVQIEDTTPRTQVSWGDVPELGVLEAIVAVNAVKAAYDASAVLNANAAKQTAVSAALTGLATVLGVL